MKQLVLVLVFLSISFHSVAANKEHKAIKKVIHTFEQTIQDKDKEGFLALFLDPQKPMVAVVTEEGFEMRKALTEKYNKEENKNLVATRTFTLMPEKAIDLSVKRKQVSRENISNVEITTDGNIANVYFDYEFMVGDKRQNWGRESWQLVQTANGWRIASVVYSIEKN